MLLVPREGQPSVVVKDYAPRSALIRRCVAPVLLRHELGVLHRVAGLPGLPAFAMRLDRWALAMEYIEGFPLDGRHRQALPAAFFTALEEILDELAQRGVFHLDLRSPSNILATRARAPALVDLASAVALRLPRTLMRAFYRRALRKLRLRFEGELEVTDESRPWERGNLELGDTRIFFRDRGSFSDLVPALFLHDIGLTSLAFEDVLALAERFGRRGIAIDLPGFGASRRRVRSLRAARLAAQLERFLDVMRLERVDLVGFGWGGYLARALADRCPDRIGTVRTAATGSHETCTEVGRDSERLRRRLKTSLPSTLTQVQRRELEYFLDLAPARNLALASESIRREESMQHSWPTPPGDPDEIWQELRRASSSSFREE